MPAGFSLCAAAGAPGRGLAGLLLLSLGACSGTTPGMSSGGAPDASLRPSYGIVHLDAGFRDDPWQLELQAGGGLDAATLRPGCTGFVAGPPDVDLVYRAGGFSLFIVAMSEAEATLVVNAPDGSWHCSGDGLDGHPLVAFARPGAGLYNIWVGTASGELEPALLLISEVDPRIPPEPGPSASGTGFFVGPGGHLLTNAHVVEDCAAIEVVEHGPAGVLLADAGADLALLRVTGRNGPHAVFQTAPPRLGADVVVLGYPLVHILGGSLNVTTGVVSGLSGVGRDPRYFQFTAPLQHGNSGGPVMDEHGLVLGVATLKLDDALELERSGSVPQNLNFAIRTAEVRAFLARVPLVPSTATGGPALPRTEISERGAAITAQVVCAD